MSLKINTYTLSFNARCPNDGALIYYTWQLKTGEKHIVEDLKATAATITEGHQEDIADQLHDQFGGEQEMWATHQGVKLHTLRLME